MKIEVKIPSVGESISKGVLTKWLKKNGDIIGETEGLLEMETEKVNFEVPSPGTGKLETLAKDGEEIKIGQVVGYIDTDFKPAMKIQEQHTKQEGKPVMRTQETEVTGTTVEESQRLSPAVRRIVDESKINTNGMEGTGKDGRITKGDVMAKLNEVQSDKRQTRVKMSPIRSTIARNLVHAKQESAHLTTFNEINMEHVMNIRAKHKDDFIKKYGIKLGYMSFFVKGACQALKTFPDVNTFVSGEEIVFNHFYNIGIAVAVEEGLIVPVIKDADKMSFAQIELKINELAEKARERKITIDDLQNGTFTITNGGIFGSMLSTPIPNFPQTAILGMHAVKDRPYVVEGKIEIRPIMYVALTYDHRVIDGKEAVEFLMCIKQYIEDPESLLIEV